MNPETIVNFDVNDARNLTKKAKTDSTRVIKIVNFIVKEIETQAKLGKTCLNYPFDKVEGRGKLSFNPTVEEKQIVKDEFVKRGFTWDHRDSQDSGSVVDRPIDIISW